MTCFDVTPRLDLIRAYSSVSAGLMLNPAPLEPQLESVTDHNMRAAALHGYGATFVDRHFDAVPAGALVDELLDRAEAGLAGLAIDASDIALLRAMARDRRVPADSTLVTWQSTGSWPEFLDAHRSLREGE